MTDTATAAAETPVAPVDTSPPHPAPDASPNGETPGALESNAQEGSGAGEPAAANPEGEQGQEEKRKRQTAQERIDAVTAKRREAERRESAALARVAELEKQLRPPPAHASLEEQDDYRVRKGLTDWRVDELKSEAAAAKSEAVTAMFDKFAAKAEAVADRMPGLVEKFSSDDLHVSEAMADFVAESEKGAEVAFHLVSNPREAHRIWSLPPVHQGIELARLEGKLSVAPQIRKTSAAPSPVPTVTGNSSSASKSVDEFSVSEMQAHLKKKGVLR